MALNLRVQMLETRDQAVAVSKLVYEKTGLTHHRAWLYRPDDILAKNRAGHVRSFLAMVGPRCVGHLAAIAPNFDEAESVVGKGNRVVGLDLVHPEVASHGVRQQLMTSLYGWATTQDLAGLVFRCPTDDVEVQRLARALGAVPTALLLGSVPRGREGRPMSVLCSYLALEDSPHQTVFLPRPDQDVYEAVYDHLAERRTFASSTSGRTLGSATELRVHFDSTRQVGRIHVLRAGPDLHDQVLERYRWLMGGQIRHVTLHSPMDTPFTAQAALSWKGHGMALAGVLPGHGRGDVAVFQGIAESHLDRGAIRVVDPLSAMLRERVLADWQRARDLQQPARWMEAPARAAS